MERIITVDRSSDTSFVATNNKLAPCDNQQYVLKNCDVIRGALMLISSWSKDTRLPQDALLPHRAEWVTLRYSPKQHHLTFFLGPPVLNDVIFCILYFLSKFSYFKAYWRLIQNVYIFNKIIFLFLKSAMFIKSCKSFGPTKAVPKI